MANATFQRQQSNVSRENLADPELEFIDPTPNIHALFMQFDKRYFWSSLSTVVVRWSKKMYSCAGICRYEGRGGLCDIALSEPLLKLRPRKDLVETLLHEMIHAYLFLSDGDRDRDGHGPNFCKHMYRINKAANINISIYHSFHDEVRLYQTHWWRCDGPCNKHKPYFGIVRRTANRAPGKNDFWWAEHQSKCGGTFIKIKEPENFKARPRDKNKSKEKTPDMMKFVDKTPRTNQNNMIPSSSGSIVGKTLGSIGNIIKSPTNAAEAVRNHWANKSVLKPIGNVVNAVLSLPAQSIKRPSLSPVKNTLVKYFPVLNNSNASSTPPVSQETANKMLLEIYGNELFVVKNGEPITPPRKKMRTSSPINIEWVTCPSCSVVIKSEEINEHLDICLKEERRLEVGDLTNIEASKCPVCDTLVSSIEEHLEVCLTSFDTSIPEEGKSNEYIDDDLDESLTFNETGTKAPCPACFVMIETASMNDHLDVCLI